MSRIDEALRRASGGRVANRQGITRIGDAAAARRADDFTLEQYPNEHPFSPNGGDRASRDEREHPGVAALPTGSRGRLAPVQRDSKGELVMSPGPVLVEQYRRLAAALHDAQSERGLRTVMITSARPQEGKTVTAINLALTLGKSYARRVLLTDADLRQPSVHEHLGMGNEIGLSEALHGDWRELPLIEVSPLLTVLPAGQPEPNPLAALTSARMRVLLDECAARFDWVLLDAPPVGLLPDAQLLARLTQAVVFVIGAGSTPFPVVEKAIAELGRERIIGTVLNGLEDRTQITVQ
jgi:capsular exopolysaccharide synthesis family protein